MKPHARENMKPYEGKHETLMRHCRFDTMCQFHGSSVNFLTCVRLVARL